MPIDDIGIAQVAQCLKIAQAHSLAIVATRHGLGNGSGKVDAIDGVLHHLIFLLSLGTTAQHVQQFGMTIEHKQHDCHYSRKAKHIPHHIAPVAQHSIAEKPVHKIGNPTLYPIPERKARASELSVIVELRIVAPPGYQQSVYSQCISHNHWHCRRIRHHQFSRGHDHTDRQAPQASRHSQCSWHTRRQWLTDTGGMNTKRSW